MKRIDLSIQLSCLLPSYSGLPAGIACTVFETPDRTVLVVEAPNWAHAYSWGPAAALKAWCMLQESPARLNAWNPADTETFKMYLLRPGFPVDNLPLWEDSFSYYLPRTRASTLTQQLWPESGTATVKLSQPLNFQSIFEFLGLEPQELQHYDYRGLLK